MDKRLYELSARVGAALQARSFVLVTAESCTGGWIGEAVTMAPGSSRWYERGFITYTNAAKREMLSVQEETLEKFGAVSEETAHEMVAGALANSAAQVAVAVSGVAGPGGGTPAKPVGTVCIAWGLKGQRTIAETQHFSGDRESIRKQSVERALAGVLAIIDG
ncbi:MAG TPA: CinA family protein [Burkholderiales bacterium]|nr:CinA family protein [Burkholderiales bacterium]